MAQNAQEHHYHIGSAIDPIPENRRRKPAVFLYGPGAAT